MILYLHGFRSSPQSVKARKIADYMRTKGRSDEFVCPQLPASPKEAIALAQDCMARAPSAEWALIGSSLGGFYATWLAERTGCRAALLNPAIRPQRDLQQHVGATTAYHSGAPFEFRAEYADELAAFSVSSITLPQRYLLVAATGDEALDWREMTAHYAGAEQCVIEGSDHGLSDFDDYIDRVMSFCGIAGEAR